MQAILLLIFSLIAISAIAYRYRVWIKKNWKRFFTVVVAGGLVSTGLILYDFNPPAAGNDSLGYELLNSGTVFHMWNSNDDYYFNRSNGVQFTNHYEEYWTKNVLMLGYYNNDQWNLLHRTDSLSGFTEILDYVADDYINVTLWKDLSYNTYDYRLALRYSLAVDDSDLTITPYIKNQGIAIFIPNKKRTTKDNNRLTLSVFKVSTPLLFVGTTS